MNNVSIGKKIEYRIGKIIISLFKSLIYVGWIAISVFIFLIVLESAAYFMNNPKQPFFYDKALAADNKHIKEKREHIFQRDVDFIHDPLLGWGRDTSKIRGYEMRNNCVYLEYLDGTTDSTLVLFITGGSAADVIFQTYNWPVKLFEKLKRQHINCKIYVGAVSGYNSSQEVLKFMIDGMEVKDISFHISYFGANENLPQSYITDYEQYTYTEFSKRNKSFLLPNLTSILWRLYLGDYEIKIVPPRVLKDNQTLKNLSIFSAWADRYGYTFIPVLQPSLGAGNLVNGYEDFGLKDSTEAANLAYAYQMHKDAYDAFFRANDSIRFKYYDFTNIFQHIQQYPLIDDCHVKEEYQHLISDKIYHIITNRE